MKQVEMKNPVPYILSNETHAVIKVEEVELKTTGIKLPNVSKTDKTKKIGEVKFASYKDKHLIGSLVEIDPWRTTPIIYNGMELIELPIHQPVLIIEKEKLEEIFRLWDESEQRMEEEAKEYE